MSMYRNLPPLRTLYTLLVVVAVASGCGGGSDSRSPTDPGGASAAAFESASFQLVNSARRDEGVEPELRFDPALAEIARGHSEAMRDRGFFGHEDPEGQSFDDRLRTAGVAYTAVAENLAHIQRAGDPAAFAHEQFLANPPHRANILDPRFTHLGVGAARRGDTWWITQLYIRR